ncbi:hypothetical protein [Nocardioides houyundeii]|uniref:hypothetical protein n=1 Tax=Nocardioides houyundeii TaxID=2045452 RepID=UPI000C75B4E2|nr:hypothetical protein [Nocardioides houyundeii]
MRTSDLVSSGPYWQMAQPVMAAAESPIHMAHLRCVQGTQDFTGTLFVTSHQVIWRAVDPRVPEGMEFALALTDLAAVEQPSRVAVFHAFRVVTEDQGRPVDTYFFPQSRTDTDRLLCDLMFDQVLAAWNRVQSGTPEHLGLSFTA